MGSQQCLSYCYFSEKTPAHKLYFKTEENPQNIADSIEKQPLEHTNIINLFPSNIEAKPFEALERDRLRDILQKSITRHIQQCLVTNVLELTPEAKITILKALLSCDNTLLKNNDLLLLFI